MRGNRLCRKGVRRSYSEKGVYGMGRRVAAMLLVVGTIALLCVGCGGGSRKVNPLPTSGLFPDYSGPTGSLVLHVVWPVNTREIPPETTVIDIEVTGEGLPTARKAQIQRPNDSARIDNLPIGQKGVSATARERPGGPALAYGFATTIVEPNKVKDVVITLQRIKQIGIAQARALVQEVRDSAISLSSGIANELVNQSLVWQADLVPTFALTMQRLDFVHAILTRAHDADLGENGNGWAYGTLTELPPATYKAQLLWMDKWWWGVELKKIGDAPAPDTWVVQFPESDALLEGMTLTFKLVRRENNLKMDEGEFKVTSNRESQLLYEGKWNLELDAQKRVTKLTVSGTFKDKFLPDGITVEGTLTGTPQGEKSYTQVRFTGSISSPKLRLTVGEATATFNPQQDVEKWYNFLTKAELKNFQFETRGVTEPITVTGELSVETVFDEQTPEKGPLPKKGTFRGGYQSSNLTFEGTIAFDWQNPQRELTEVPKGTASISGRWAMRNKPIFSVSLTLTSASPFEVAIDITRGEHFLRGELTGDWKVEDEELKVTDWSVSLENENNLSVEFSKGSESGVIKAPDGSKLADIQKDPDLDLLVVRYIDGTLESLQPADFTFQPHPITGTVRGRVVDAQTNQPIEGAWVWSGYEGTSTDAQGFFELRTLAGTQTIHVEHWNYSPQDVEVDVPPRGEVNIGEIRLQPRPLIYGRVTNAQTGSPIVGAPVEVRKDWWGWWGSTDPQGQYRVTVPEPGTYIVRVGHPDYESAEQQVTLQAGEQKEVNFALRPISGGGSPAPPPLE